MIDFSKIESFLDRIFLELLRNEIDVSYFELDHICYRVETQKEYVEGKEQLSELWELLIETEIWGRCIATYKLLQPIIYQNRKIYIIELPAPKQRSEYKTWFEHVEFVVDESLEAFMSDNSQVDFKTKALSKEINPDISLNFWDISVKFHWDTLENVIKFEQS